MILRFPEIGVPPVIIHFNGIFLYKPSSYGGTPIDGNPHFEPSDDIARSAGASPPQAINVSPCNEPGTVKLTKPNMDIDIHRPLDHPTYFFVGCPEI